MAPTPLDQATNNKFIRDEKEKDTFIRRLKRSLKCDIHQNSVEEFFQAALHIDHDAEPDDFPFSLGNLQRLMDQHPGSKTAMALLESSVCTMIGMEALDRGDIKLASSALADAYRQNSMVVRWELTKVKGAMQAFHSLYSDTNQDAQNRAEALFVHANLLFLQKEFTRGLTEIKVAQRLLVPNEDPFFAATEGCILAMLLEVNGAQKAYERAARLGCDDPEHTLFHQAILPTRRLSDDARISLLEEYVKCAEPDARKLPEACYRLAMRHGLKGPRHLGNAKRYFIRGQKADQDRITLSLFPDEAKELRSQAQALVKRYHSCGRRECNSSATKNCSACAQVYYCSPDRMPKRRLADPQILLQDVSSQKEYRYVDKTVDDFGLVYHPNRNQSMLADPPRQENTVFWYQIDVWRALQPGQPSICQHLLVCLACVRNLSPPMWPMCGTSTM